MGHKDLTNKINALESKSRFLLTRLRLYRKHKLSNSVLIRKYNRQISELGLTVSDHAIIKYISLVDTNYKGSLYSNILDVKHDILLYCKQAIPLLNDGNGKIKLTNYNIRFLINNYNIYDCEKIN